MLILDARRRHQPVPSLARWCLGAGIAATIGDRRKIKRIIDHPSLTPFATEPRHGLAVPSTC
jgi:hypothetical protein